MSGLLAFLFPSPIVQGITAGCAGFVTWVVPILIRKAKAAWLAAEKTL